MVQDHSVSGWIIRPGADDGQFRPADAGDGPSVRIGTARRRRPVGGVRLEARREVLDEGAWG